MTSKKHECCLQFWINIYVLLDWFDTIFLWCFGKNSRSANNASFAIIKLPEILRLSQSLYNRVLFIQHNLKFRLQSLWISVIYRTDGTSSFKFLKQTLINFQFFEVGTINPPHLQNVFQKTLKRHQKDINFWWLFLVFLGFWAQKPKNTTKSHQKLMSFRCLFRLNFEDEGATKNRKKNKNEVN